MKFSYEDDFGKRDEDVVAFIHNSGCLIIKLDNTYSDYCQVVDSNSLGDEKWWWKWMGLATKKFYAGDKLTIEF